MDCKGSRLNFVGRILFVDNFRISHTCTLSSSDLFLENGIRWTNISSTVYPKKYVHGFCFAVLCCGYTLTDFPISIRLTSLALWQSNDCPSASKATLMNMDKYFMWIHYERLNNHNKAKHNKTVCIFLGIYCMLWINDYIHAKRWDVIIHPCPKFNVKLEFGWVIACHGNPWMWLPIRACVIVTVNLCLWTYCGLVTPYGDRDQGQHRLR